MTDFYLLALINLAVCTAIGWSCVCRIAVMDGRTTLLSFRLKYAFLLVAATASGFGPALLGSWPEVADVLLNTAFLYMMAGGARAWRGGVPDYATRPGALT